MYKKWICLISTVLLLTIVGNASAADVDWNNAGGDRLWRNSANWVGGAVPTSGDKAAIRSGVSGPIIDASTTAQANQVVLGDWGSTSDTLDMTGGSLATGAWFILGYGSVNNGTFAIGAGAASVGTDMFVGFMGTGTLNMTGGTITVTGAFGIAQSGGIGHVQLNGGTITSGTFSMTSGATMNITTGTLIVNGDVTTTINQYISNGWITAYGGTGTLNVDYNVTNPGKTTVTAAPPGQEPSPTDWTNGSGDRLWRTPANWNGGAVPTLSDKAAIRNDTISGPIIDSSTTAEANQVVVGDWGSTSDTLDMTGGTLTTNEWLILGYDSNNSGTFTMSDGTVGVGNDLYVGFAGIGTLDITGGLITVTSIFGIAQTGGTGYVYLDGGTITSTVLNMATGAVMDITTGTLILDGDATTTINEYIGNGWIIAYGGSGAVNIDYNVTNPLKTTVTATMPSEPPTKATNPNPPNSATGVSIFPTLSWSPGLRASSHDVYFGTTSPGTFRGNQTAATYNPGVLNQNTVYYWRIDEKNIIGTTTGDVWSFTTVADSNYTLLGKVMCGYQGWFNCPGDGTTRGWVHWGIDGFSPTNCTVDMWPDMTEMGSGEKFLASAFYDGTDHYVFSSHNNDTVVRHFQWMQDYGIDGVYLQRFATDIAPGSPGFNHRNDVLDYCKNGANLYGRKYAIMYDLSGLGSGSDIQKVVDDWKYLVDNSKVTKNPDYDPGYMFHQGKPVVGVWGLGYGRAYEGQATRNLIDFLKNDPTYGGNIVVIGVHKNWRTNGNSWFQQTLQLADIICPWLVGAYSTTSGVKNWANSKGVPDKEWCDSNGKEYLPIMFPGFSWYNLHGGPFNQIPRAGGQFLWDQVKADISTVGASMLYVAMFDEVDEATAIFKVTNDPPVTPPAQFVTYDIDGYPLPSDEYLWLVGQASRGLRGEIPVNQTRPSRGASPPGQATNPSPSDGAIDVSTTADLSWTAGSDADSHDVYFGTDPTPDGSEFQGNQTGTTFDPGTMANSTTYYWRIDEVNANGTTTGVVWSFTTEDAPPPPPGQATNPSPADGAIDVSTTADLSWTAGSDADSHDVYFGTDPTPDGSEFQGNQTGTTFDPGTMANSTTYYWRIDEVNASGTTTGVVWSFTTEAPPPPPGQATNPSPADGATDVSVNADLSWTAGSGADSHDVYFGTDPTPDAGEFQGNQTGTTFDPGTMANSTTYYWRIDEVNASGTTTGVVWSFTTEAVPPPGQATNPSPADGATDVSVNADLSWTAGSGADSHDVYFGTDPTPDAGEFQGNQTGTTFDPGTMAYSTTYYWRIDEVNAGGTTTGVVWSFTTEAAGCVASTTHVESIVCRTVRGSQGKKYGQVTVTIYDNCGDPVGNADVTGTFTGDFNEQLTETTNGSGVAVITTTTQVKKPSYTFCVDSVTHATLTYDPNDNVETCDSN